MDIKNEAKNYADYQVQIDNLKKLQQEIGDIFLLEMEKMSVKKLAISEIGTFSITERKSWKYGSDVEAFMNQVKEAKRIEENSRSADEVTRSLRFQRIKGGGE